MTVEIQTEHGSYKLPNAMTVDELISEGKSPDQARKIMHERVFGVDYPVDDKGNPIERGLGGPLQQTGPHLQALKVAREREARGPMGSSLDADALAKAVVAAVQASGSSNSADVIAKAVAAGVQAGLAAAKEDF